jgi:L-lactate dehydrogenase complex protein LldG
LTQCERTNRPGSRCPRFLISTQENLLTLWPAFANRSRAWLGSLSPKMPNLDSFLRTKFPDAKIICSAIPEYAGTIKPASFQRWSDASTIDVCILRSPMGVAETGSILLSDNELQVNTIAFLAHDLVVLLDPKQIVANIHDAYEHPYFKLRHYSVLMTGPSGSGDIGWVVVHPAQAAKTLTVLLSPSPDAGQRNG